MKQSKYNSNNFFEFYIKNLSHDANKITQNVEDYSFMQKYFKKNLRY